MVDGADRCRRFGSWPSHEVQQEVTGGTLGTSGAPEGNPRVLQIQTDRQQPASGFSHANTEETKMNHSPGAQIIHPKCPTYHSVLGSESFGTQDYWQLVESKLFMRSLT